MSASLTQQKLSSASGRGRRRYSGGHPARVIGLCLVTLLFGAPIVWMVVMSFKATPEILADAMPLSWRSVVPQHATFENYVSILTNFAFGRNLINSAVITVCQVIGSVVTATISGYAFARMEFRGRNVLFLICLSAAFVPIEAIFLPEFRLVSALGFDNSYLGVFLPFMYSPFAIFLMRQSFLELPKSMFEAASLDGLGVWRSFVRVGLPNVKAPLVTVTLVQFIWAWNSYIWPLVIVQDPGLQTAQVAAAYFKSVPNQPMNGELMAALSLTCIPLLVLAIILQKYYVRGLVMSGSKG
ncbi:carbohydrate ABC transporter permease [Arthrobacter sp. MI7-26]|uniref:carbohydrate ABC transporter permease n=1 Tax=Arthrobacter sp. MI7-26 TaxID=2993653 RepID=UPI00224932E2|nr:carbohydrate ABC transporter permease [Arthrobacter sp. MI7-26]MCX2750459.1 carbohydrate ABC transporter permease [Arthrobacter sp. MI7-26]